ncbi:hypothetical protein D9M69_672530 [compost metagenome]
MTTFWIMIAMPSAESIGARRDLLRKGLYAATSIDIPRTPIMTNERMPTITAAPGKPAIPSEPLRKTATKAPDMNISLCAKLIKRKTP